DSPETVLEPWSFALSEPIVICVGDALAPAEPEASAEPDGAASFDDFEHPATSRAALMTIAPTFGPVAYMAHLPSSIFTNQVIRTTPWVGLAGDRTSSAHFRAAVLLHAAARAAACLKAATVVGTASVLRRTM